MNKILLILSVIITLNCCRQDPPEPYSIEGRWVDLTGTLSPEWHYHFEDGILTQSYVQFGAQITKLTYPYAIRDSLVYIGGDTTNAPREWQVHFECDDVIRVTQTGAMINHRFWLKRE